jgi:hypothetical protein
MKARTRSLLLSIGGILMLGGCPRPTTAAEEPPPAPETAAPIAPAAAPSEEKPAESGAIPPPREQTSDVEDRLRPIKYVPTATGLEIQLDGVKFAASASAVKVGTGWGVSVKTRVSGERGKSYKLLTPKRGPLAFTGSVERRGQKTQLADEREGDQTTVVKEQPIEFSREWPGDSKQQPLGQGDKLSLEVELWGVSGNNYDKPLPAKPLFVVRVSSGSGKPVVSVKKPVFD